MGWGLLGAVGLLGMSVSIEDLSTSGKDSTSNTSYIRGRVEDLAGTYREKFIS